MAPDLRAFPFPPYRVVDGYGGVSWVGAPDGALAGPIGPPIGTLGRAVIGPPSSIGAPSVTGLGRVKIISRSQ